jgi:hypothetical protein
MLIESDAPEPAGVDPKARSVHMSQRIQFASELLMPEAAM